MKLPFEDNNNDDAEVPPVVPPSDELFAAQQKHQFAERKALLYAIIAYLLSPDPTTLGKILMRWESGFLDLLHVGSWKSIWDLLDAARPVRGFCSSGVVIFGYGQQGHSPVDLNQSVVHEKLIVDMVCYGVHAYTLELAAKIDAAGRAGNQAKFDELTLLFMNWIKANPKEYRLFHHFNDEIMEFRDFEAFALPCAKGVVADLLPKINNTLSKIVNRVFVFVPTPEDTAAGWRGFFEFARGYSRLPDSIISQFEKYLFECDVPSSPVA